MRQDDNIMAQDSIDNMSSVDKVKLREFQRSIGKFRYKNFFLIDGSGKIIFTVFPGKYENVQNGFSETDRNNLLEIFEKLEKLQKTINSLMQ